jgi:cyanophycin synthetase
MISGTGSRRDEDIVEFGKAVGGVYDHIVVTDTDPEDRASGETAALVLQGITSTGLPETRVSVVLDGREATRAALGMASSGDVVVLQADDFQQALADVIAFRDALLGQTLQDQRS